MIYLPIAAVAALLILGIVCLRPSQGPKPMQRDDAEFARNREEVLQRLLEADMDTQDIPIPLRRAN